MTSQDVVLEARGVTVQYGTGESALRAVDAVTLSLHRGEVLGVVGESGCGKSTLAYAMTRLLRPPGVITAGDLLYHARDGKIVNILMLGERELRQFRWEQLAIVFQSAMNALNPVITLRTQLSDVLNAHRPKMGKKEREERIHDLLRTVGISPQRAGAYPHELSGGMRQRAMIAVALALEPEIIVMDEPTTALDVVMQRRILAQIMNLRKRLGFSVIFITHDLSLLVATADVIAVMYAGKLVEVSPAGDLYRSPRHPYSQGLLNSFPNLHGPLRELNGITGSPPDLRTLPPGCPFHPRCPYIRPPCTARIPELVPSPVPSDPKGRLVSCLLYTEDDIGPPPESLALEETRVP
jgi:peptide/nickel transport system ATP-binding protein